jgi:hypothetical protein
MSLWVGWSERAAPRSELGLLPGGLQWRKMVVCLPRQKHLGLCPPGGANPLSPTLLS